MIEAAKDAGLDAMIFADHGHLAPPGHLAELNAVHAPFRIFPGTEVSVPAADLVVVGLEDPELERDDWTYERLHRFVAERDGFLFLAHPFRFHGTVSIDVENFPPGAVEINSSNMGEVDVSLLCDFVAAHNLPCICNSDAHAAELVGIYYTVLDCFVDSARDLVSVLKSGRFRCGRMDERIASLNALGLRVYR
jgi:predicted metal-dependent phosphoesterase TrpH